jgi:hypothetical protein
MTLCARPSGRRRSDLLPGRWRAPPGTKTEVNPMARVHPNGVAVEDGARSDGGRKQTLTFSQERAAGILESITTPSSRSTANGD